MSIRRVALITATAAALAWPTVAVGQSVPPGSSELDQYVPTAPHSGGNQQAGGQTGDDLGGGGGGATVAPSVSGAAPTARGTAPSASGEAPALDATAAADAIAGPAAEARSRYLPGLHPSANSEKRHAQKRHAPGGSGESPVGATLYTLSGGTTGGLGLLLPFLLGSVFALGIVYALRQRRSSSGR
jgi:hypothetical protein